MPTVEPPISSAMPATEKITENMITVATRATTVSSTTMTADAFTIDCVRSM